MKGLCRVCFTSNAEVEIEEGEAICIQCKNAGKGSNTKVEQAKV